VNPPIESKPPVIANPNTAYDPHSGDKEHQQWCARIGVLGAPGSSRRAWRAGPRIPLAQAADSIMGEAAAISTGSAQADSPQSFGLVMARRQGPGLGVQHIEMAAAGARRGFGSPFGTCAANLFDRLNQAPADQKKNCPTQRANQESS
jgi:hypothetical protein